MRATLSLLGLYNYDNSVLDGLTLPDNFSASDLEILKNNILLETAEFEVLYSDPVFLKFAITQWCNKRKPTWKWLKDTQNYEYNPLWNENYTDNVERDLKGTLDATDVRTDALKEMTTGTETTNKTGTDTDAKSGNDSLVHSGNDTQKKTGSDTTINSVYAMNEQATASPNDGSNVTYNSQIKTEYDSTDRTNYNSQNQTTYNNQDQLTHNTSVDNTGTQTQKLDHDTTDTGTVNRTVQGIHGAFAQDAIKKEQELALFNVLDFITTDFKKRFCLLVY